MSANLTAYKAAQVVNAALAEAGLDSTIPAQMMYNYTTARLRKGQKPLIPTITVDGKVFIEAEGFAKWLGTYISKKVALSTVSE
jgi:hypothetical protein